MLGYDVMIGTRDVTKPDLVKFASDNTGMKIGTFAESAAFADFAFLATLGGAAVDCIKICGPDNLKGKIVIDATNPISGAPVNGVFPYFTAEKSLLEMLQETYPEIKFAKGFSSTGATTFYKPQFKDGLKGSLFTCGNYPEAKELVVKIGNQFGWEVEDAGDATMGRPIESLCILWCFYGFARNDWYHAFKVIRP